MRGNKYVLLLVLLFGISLYAEVPYRINYQGKLTNPDGVAYHDVTLGITFRIFDVESGGTALWTETHSSVHMNHGLFDVILGTTSSMESLDFDGQYYLELEVSSEVLAPRQPFSSMPYAIRASIADTALVAMGIEGGSDNYIARWDGDNSLEASIIYETDEGLIGIGTETPALGTRLEVIGTGTPGEKAIVGKAADDGPEGWLGTGLYGAYGNFNSENFGYLGASGYGLYATGELHAGYFEGQVDIIGNLYIEANDTIFSDVLASAKPDSIHSRNIRLASDLDVAGNVIRSNNLAFESSVAFDDNIVPASPSASLGTATYPWEDLYLDGDVYLGAATAVTIDGTAGTDGQVLKADASGNLYWADDETGITEVSHNELSGLQGGTDDEYYHLTEAEHTGLTTGIDTDLHNHDSRYYRNTQLANADSGAAVHWENLTDIPTDIDMDATDDITIGSTAGGDLSGAYPDPTVSGIQGVPVATVAPTTDQVLTYNGTQWIPASVEDGSTTNELNTDIDYDASSNVLSITDAGGTLTTTIMDEADYLEDNVMNDLGDVNFSLLTDGQVIQYNDVTSSWENVDLIDVGDQDLASVLDHGNVADMNIDMDGNTIVNVPEATASGEVMPYGQTALGDLTGNYPAPEIANGAVSDDEIDYTTVTLSDFTDDIGLANAAELNDGNPATTPVGFDDLVRVPADLDVDATDDVLIGSTAGGQLSGTYPDPNIAVTAIGDGLTGGDGIQLTVVPGNAITVDGTGVNVNVDDFTIEVDGSNNLHVIGAAPTGAAGGDLTGLYPDPELANGVVSDDEMDYTTVTLADFTDDVGFAHAAELNDGNPATTPVGFDDLVRVPGDLDVVASDDVLIGSAAGGQLSGTYPDPNIAASVAGNALDGGDGAPIDVQVDGITVTINGDNQLEAIAAVPAGAAGGDLMGSYPDPEINFSVIRDNEMDYDSVTLADFTNDAGLAYVADLNDGDSTTTPVGWLDIVGEPENLDIDATDDIMIGTEAGGQLSGTYPDPNIAISAVGAGLAGGDGVPIGVNVDGSTIYINGDNQLEVIEATPSGTAGGQLSGTYPDPNIAAAALGNGLTGGDGSNLEVVPGTGITVDGTGVNVDNTWFSGDATVAVDGTIDVTDDAIDESEINWGHGEEQVDAESVPYDNTTSGLTGDNVQSAIDEVVADLHTGYVENRAVDAELTTGQDASLDITGNAEIGGDLAVDNIVGQGTASASISTVTEINSTSAVTLATIVYTAAGPGSTIQLDFSGTFDDQANTNNAYMNIEIVRDPSGSATIVSSTEIVLFNRHMYSITPVMLMAVDAPPAGEHTYAIRANMINEPYNAGRCTNGLFRLAEIKN